jgi:GDP-D-mannose dehydratase
MNKTALITGTTGQDGAHGTDFISAMESPNCTIGTSMRTHKYVFFVIHK